MPKLSIETPNTFRVDDTIYPAFGHYTMKIKGEDHIGLEEVGDNHTAVIPTHYEQWTNKEGVPYKSLDQLKVDLGLAITWGMNYISTNVGNIIEATLRERGDTENRNIKGTGTSEEPMVFEHVFEADSILTAIKFYMEDGSNFADNKFAGINELENGLLLLIKGHPVGRFKTNTDIALASDRIDSIDALASTRKHMLAIREFRRKIFIKKGESVQVFVRDNMEGVTVFNAFIQGYKL